MSPHTASVVIDLTLAGGTGFLVAAIAHGEIRDQRERRRRARALAAARIVQRREL